MNNCNNISSVRLRGLIAGLGLLMALALIACAPTAAASPTAATNQPALAPPTATQQPPTTTLTPTPKPPTAAIMPTLEPPTPTLAPPVEPPMAAIEPTQSASTTELSSTLATFNADAASTACLQCHGPYDKIVAGSTTFMTDSGENVNPHTTLDESQLKVHKSGKGIIQCAECHAPHPSRSNQSRTFPRPRLTIAIMRVTTRGNSRPAPNVTRNMNRPGQPMPGSPPLTAPLRAPPGTGACAPAYGRTRAGRAIPA